MCEKRPSDAQQPLKNTNDEKLLMRKFKFKNINMNMLFGCYSYITFFMNWKNIFTILTLMQNLILNIFSTQSLVFFSAKTPWSWGRMDDILSEGREIESRRQLEKAINQTNWKRKQARPRTTIDA